MEQFDRHATAYDQVRGKIAYPRALYTLLAANCARHDAALDLGCGNGVSTIALADDFAQVEGIDLGAKMIEKARLNYPALNFSVCPVEAFEARRRYDLITSATAFYWMDRAAVLARMPAWLSEGGVFCAYKYDFPLVYGPLREPIEREMANRWSAFRDRRLVDYDDTLELMRASGAFAASERCVLPNIIELSARQLALFFLSTSYVTRYQEAQGGEGYAATLIRELEALGGERPVKVNFDIHAFIGRR